MRTKKTVKFHDPAESSLFGPKSVEMDVYSHNEPCPGVWQEYAISNCPSGCKVYWSPINGRLVLMHNSNYGCRR